MIHTAEFTIKLNFRSKEDMKIINMFYEIEVFQKEAFTILCKIHNNGCYKVAILTVIVDFIELLGKADIKQEDASEVVYKIEEFLKDNLIEHSCYILRLTRLDFRYDIKIDNPKHRKLLIKLLKKTKEKINYMTRGKAYDYTVRLQSKSRANNIYDKEEECETRGKLIKEYEKGIIRFEAQIKNEHIKYKCKKLGIRRRFEDFFTNEMYCNYMNEMIISIVSKEDFYSLKEATKIISKDINLKESEKNELINFLKYTSTKRSLQKTLEFFKKYKFNKYIKILERLNINPVIIPEKERVDYLENPLRNLINQINILETSNS